MTKLKEIIEKQLEGNTSDRAIWAREALRKGDIDRAMIFASNEIAEKPEDDLLRAIRIIEVYQGWVKALI